ncbi:MAG TPA: AmmeMemoRadiSam system protein A [Candidatus Sulfotelmatobacter sp.]|nr:AmmeMemoRadiSam system protein A [Candidatus Sulfotelmatobacter sp.]
MSLPQPSSISVANSPEKPAAGADFEFSPAERTLLLSLAHEAIVSGLQRREIPLDPPTAHLAELRGVFTSLYRQGQLRGCVGYVFPTTPLYRAVAETARAAAFDDNRFNPVKLDEAVGLQVELSILSPPQPITADAVEVGRHGLLISSSGFRGLLLPQVPLEHSWDRTTFLEQTCRKAGLPLDAWQKGAAIEAFTAEVFGDCSG